MTFTVERPVDAYVAAPVISPQLGSFVSITDLIEVLEDYYAGTLDEPREPHLICRPLHEWHPSNNLWAQLDSHQLGGLIRQLSTEQQMSLRVYFVSANSTPASDDIEIDLFLVLQSAIDSLLAAVEQVL